MRFQDFERAAREAYRRIPEEYRVGIDGLRVVGEAPPHPSASDVYTLGECVTEAYPSDWEGPDTTRSVVVLYHGSFERLSELDPDFDWEEELWETLTHELRHHLEWLARQDDLEGVDYAMDEEFKRWEGEPFDPWYYQRGDRVAEHVYRVERHVYLEQIWTEKEFERADRIRFEWKERQWEVERPDALGDVHFLFLEGGVGLAELEGPRELEGPAELDRGESPDVSASDSEDVQISGDVPGDTAGDPAGGAGSGPEASTVELVLVRKIGWWEGILSLFSGRRPEVLESEATARPAPDGDSHVAGG